MTKSLTAVAADPGTPAAFPSSQHTGLACLVIAARHRGLHLSVAQLVHDHALSQGEPSTAAIVKCARSSGLKAKLVRLGVSDLTQLKKALPAIVRLNNNTHMVLLRVESDGDAMRIVLQDPNADSEAVLAIDQVRFAEVWTGEVILVRRNYDILDENQPFGLGLVTGLIVRERLMVADLAICAFALGLFGLTPIVFMRLVSSQVINYRSFNTLNVLLIGLVLAIGFETLFGYVRRLLVLHLTTRLDVKLSTYIFDKVLNLPIDYFERTPVGEITHDVYELNKIRRFLMGQLFGTVLDSTTLLFLLPVMFLISWEVSLVVMAICAAIVVWLIVMMPYYRRKSSAAEEAETRRSSFLVQTIHGMRTVKSLSLDARQRHLWDVHVARVAKLRLEEGMCGNMIHSVTVPMERFAVTGTLGLGVYIALSSENPLALGALFAFWMLSSRVVHPLLQVAQLVNQYEEVRLAVANVKRLVNQPPEEGRTGQGVRTPLAGHVQFSKVTFKYKGAHSSALQDVTFDVPQGTMLGIMGKSGSGKTTITRLIQRLHSNYDGLIKIDGIDVREYDIDHLRRSIGVVMQENFLFSGTIRDNIAAAKTDASFEEIVRAARLSGAEEFIDKLPRGYDTFIYEGSPNLSGGQRQRLAIARALILDPRILILDEATSALDADSEAIVTANISRIAQGRTLIIVSHRLSSLASADAIMVVDGGRVQDIGKHQELLERCDLYSELWHTQNRHIIESTQRRSKPPFRSPTLVS